MTSMSVSLLDLMMAIQNVLAPKKKTDANSTHSVRQRGASINPIALSEQRIKSIY